MMNQPGRRPLDGWPFWTSPERPDGQSVPAHYYVTLHYSISSDIGLEEQFEQKNQ